MRADVLPYDVYNVDILDIVSLKRDVRFERDTAPLDCENTASDLIT